MLRLTVPATLAAVAMVIATPLITLAEDAVVQDAFDMAGKPTLSDLLAQGYRIVGTTQGTSSSSTIYHLQKGTNVVRCRIQHAHSSGVCV